MIHTPHRTGTVVSRPRAATRLVTLLAVVAFAFGNLLVLPHPVRAASLATTAAVNLRSGPGTSYDVIRVVPDGATVETTGPAQSGFYPVTVDGAAGFISVDYLSSTGAVSGGGPTGTRYATGGSLNLRSGPSTGDGVIAVLPNGAAVQLTGETANGFARVTYNGRGGWAFAQYLGTGGGQQPGGEQSAGGSVAVGDTVTGRAATTAALNLRRGPGTNYGVVLVIPNGVQIELMGGARSGFQPVRYNGTTGWVSAQYLGSGAGNGSTGQTPTDGGSVPVGDTVTASGRVINGSLNLRRGPGTSYGVIRVMPNGAAVEIMGGARSGFLPVRYSGVTGWAFAEYLRTGGGGTAQPTPTPEPTPAPGGNAPVPVGDAVTGARITTAALNLRQGPGSSYAVVIVLPPGTRVDIMGSARGSFLPVRWAGRTGWAHGDWLTDPTSAPAPAPTPAPGAGTPSSDIVQIIYAAADRWGQPREDMLRVARCESNLNPRAVNASSGASGLFQFMPSTFAFTPNGKAGQDIFDPYASADAAGWMWANGMRNHWACQ